VAGHSGTGTVATAEYFLLGLPPIDGTVNDGTGADIDSQVSTGDLAANWSGFLPGDSPIAAYEVAVGTAPGAADVVPYTNVGLTLAGNFSGLSLAVGVTYYVTVRAVDALGTFSTGASSDGVTVLPAAVPRLLCPDPIGLSTSGGTRVRLRGVNLDGASGINIGATYPTVEAIGTALTVVSSTELEFTAPPLSEGQKYIEVVSSGGSDEIRNALVASATTSTVVDALDVEAAPRAYRMVSIPIFAEAGAMAEQWAACLGPADPRSWRAFVWDPVLQQYVELPALAHAMPHRQMAGRGIFAISARSADCDFTGLSTEPASTFYLCLEPGWNMMALPSRGSVGWATVRVGTKGEGSTGADDVPASTANPFIVEFLYAWEGTRYVAASSMVEGESYWVYNKTGTQAVLFVSDPVGKAGSGSVQVYSDLPINAPIPPAPPERAEEAASGVLGSSTGGGGGGDYAAQVRKPSTAESGIAVLVALSLVVIGLKGKMAQGGQVAD
jgi:hypothetical protein